MLTLENFLVKVINVDGVDGLGKLLDNLKFLTHKIGFVIYKDGLKAMFCLLSSHYINCFKFSSVSRFPCAIYRNISVNGWKKVFFHPFSGFFR